MGTPLQEQIDNPHPDADPECEGCHGSGWLTALVDDPQWLGDAGLAEPADFLMACDECDVFGREDRNAVEAARKAGMVVSDSGHVQYTDAQLRFIAGPGVH